MSAVVVFIIFAICLIIAIPISISLGIVAVLPGAFDASFTASAGYVIRSMVGGIDSFPLLAVPMFVLAGILMAHGKISEKLFDVFVYFLGNKRAGIPCAVIITCLFYGAISGSAPQSRNWSAPGWDLRSWKRLWMKFMFSLRPEKEPATLADLGARVQRAQATIPFVLDGQVLEDNLRWCGKDRAWLERTAQTNTLLPEEILLLVGNETEDYFLLKKESRRKGSSR